LKKYLLLYDLLVFLVNFFFSFFCHPNVSRQVRKIGRVVRAIAIMSHPIPNTNESHSVQIILPQKQLGRRSDM
jgi:RAB protein geranylgeranyltransferase component A